MILPILPARLEAMRCQSGGAEHCVCQLMRRLGATQGQRSRHMQVLKQAGLVVDHRHAQWMRYRISPDLSLAWLVRAAPDQELAAPEAAA